MSEANIKALIDLILFHSGDCINLSYDAGNLIHIWDAGGTYKLLTVEELRKLAQYFKVIAMLVESLESSDA